jgi:hypothetical protein
MRQLTVVRAALIGAAVTLGAQTAAGQVLIVNGASATTEPGTTSSITTQLTTLHTAVGNAVTVANTLPADLTPFRQIWDIRFSNNWALTSSEQTTYLSFLQGGGGIFLMGENSGFMAPQQLAVQLHQPGRRRVGRIRVRARRAAGLLAVHRAQRDLHGRLRGARVVQQPRHRAVDHRAQLRDLDRGRLGDRVGGRDAGQRSGRGADLDPRRELHADDRRDGQPN